jgi:hypothetical protein
VGNFPTSLLLAPNRGDRFVVDLGHLADLAIGLPWLYLQQRGDELASVLGCQLATMEVG